MILFNIDLNVQLEIYEIILRIHDVVGEGESELKVWFQEIVSVRDQIMKKFLLD